MHPALKNKTSFLRVMVFFPCLIKVGLKPNHDTSLPVSEIELDGAGVENEQST